MIRYMESAEHALLRQLGTSVMPRVNCNDSKTQSDAITDAVVLSWPRVRVESEFQSVAYFEDLLDVAVAVERLGRSSVTYQFTIRRCPKQQCSVQTAHSIGERGDDELESGTICTGRFTTVCCAIRAGHTMQSAEIPATIREGLAAYLVANSPKF